MFSFMQPYISFYCTLCKLVKEYVQPCKEHDLENSNFTYKFVSIEIADLVYYIRIKYK